ncbi:hypothetical protein C1701_22050 [Actinoalloteichus sp. AHMU CJ021]|nr:hypothetical protein C1701_22050 [Actinoalloteichus sp. AHMU CJ021]
MTGERPGAVTGPAGTGGRVPVFRRWHREPTSGVEAGAGAVPDRRRRRPADRGGQRSPRPDRWACP